LFYKYSKTIYQKIKSTKKKKKKKRAEKGHKTILKIYKKSQTIKNGTKKELCITYATLVTRSERVREINIGKGTLHTFRELRQFDWHWHKH
jgi:hypothetical protein